MQIPLQITFRGIPHSEAVEAKIREKASKLEKFHAHIMGCRVAVEAEHHSHHQGNQYHIRIDITTPRKELVISREHHDKKAYEDIYAAIRDAFNAACVFRSKLPSKPLECGHLNRSKKPPYRSVATREVYFYSISLVVVKFACCFLSESPSNFIL